MTNRIGYAIILRFAKRVHGVWQNACALGAFDERLSTYIVWCSEILLNALDIGTGNPHVLYVAREPESLSSRGSGFLLLTYVCETICKCYAHAFLAMFYALMNCFAFYFD